MNTVGSLASSFSYRQAAQLNLFLFDYSHVWICYDKLVNQELLLALLFSQVLDRHLDLLEGVREAEKIVHVKRQVHDFLYTCYRIFHHLV